MPDTYTCEACGGTFEKGWSDDEALAEKTANGFDVFACAIVCDDCYRSMLHEAANIIERGELPSADVARQIIAALVRSVIDKEHKQ